MRIEDEIKQEKFVDEIQKLIINQLFTGKWITGLIAKQLKPFKITSQQYNVLRILRGQKGKPANLSTIQERMLNKMSNTTRLIDKLLKKDLVTRQTCPTNRRKVEILITNKGLALLGELDTIVTSSNENITKQLSISELETLNQLLDKLRTH